MTRPKRYNTYWPTYELVEKPFVRFNVQTQTWETRETCRILGWPVVNLHCVAAFDRAVQIGIDSCKAHALFGPGR